ncbi:MAG: antitoxin family protein [bacterium]|nr:antitoxin family protein [bacterium]
MAQQIDAVYENGVFRPLAPVDLEEHRTVRLTIDDNGDDPLTDLLDTEFMERCIKESKNAPAPGIEAVRQMLAKIPGDLTEDFISERDEC